MANPFNPYSDWLEIPLDEQPPDHYRLLGIRPFERDPNVIASAADGQMKRVRRYQSGVHAPESQQLLNEFATARICLLDAQRRSDYELEIKRRREALNLPPLPFPEELVPHDDMPMRAPEHIRRAIPKDPENLLTPPSEQQRVVQLPQSWVLPTVVGLLAVGGLVVALIWYGLSN